MSSRKTAKSTDLELTVLANGLDFILSAIENLAHGGDVRKLKYAVLHMHAGVELVLKERLRQEHWSLVFSDIAKARKADFETGVFKSVAFDDCVGRLENVVGIRLSEQQKQALNAVRQKRNQLEHFGTVASAEALSSSVVQALNVVLEFVSEQFEDSKIHGSERVLIAKVRSNLERAKEFVDDRLKFIEPELAKKRPAVVYCPDCNQDTSIVHKGTKCAFCGARENVEDAIAAHVFSTASEEGLELASENWPSADCPHCDEDALVDRTFNGEIPRFLCFNCAKSWDSDQLSDCAECGRPYELKDGYPSLCASCGDKYFK